MQTEWPLCNEFSWALLTFSAHQHWHSRRALQWNPSLLVNLALRSTFRCYLRGSNAWVWSQGYDWNVRYVLSLQDQALYSQHMNMGTLHGRYSALLKNRLQLILGIRKYETHKWVQFDEICVVEAVSWCSWKLHRRRFQRTIVRFVWTLTQTFGHWTICMKLIKMNKLAFQI